MLFALIHVYIDLRTDDSACIVFKVQVNYNKLA
jgi:hypothetical protein